MFRKVLVPILIIFLVMGCEEDDGNGNGTGTTGDNEVSMENIQFVPQTLTIEVGATVTWINNDNVNHTATRTGMFDSGTMAPGTSFQYTFYEAGTFDYVCTLHPSMEGIIIVE